ncbi:TIGR03086 family metal-binding protein [Streptomyces sp. NRRL S-87]|uniref:TIGR03086 family metal-binding protein n=1 Tax=Streptomyces sp. NRRL S-87 TaxID=1463920 RepID=UPI0004BE7EC9|nr:TIGR03086 family metal-binding protein [Streptomyces sp. NRRL S-87]
MDDKQHSISSLLAAAAARAVPVVRGVDERQLGGPTPCSGYSVRELLDHFFDVVVNFTRLGGKKPSAFAEKPDYLGTSDWRERFADEVDRLVSAWGAPGAEEGTTGAMHQPARTVGCMALLDLTVHAWDLARATGQEYVPDPAGVATLAAVIDELAPAARDAGMFDEPVHTAADPSPFEELLAATGRDPYWS